MGYIGIFLIPILGMTGFIILVVKGRYRALAIATAFFIATVLTGIWGMLQSRNSTAAFSLIVLPAYGTVSAFFAALFVRANAC